MRKIAIKDLAEDQRQVCDISLRKYVDLMSPAFYAWYCKSWYILGDGRFMRLASVARADGRQPKKLFSKLLKDELGKPEHQN